MANERPTILGIGNVYVETNYLGLNTASSDSLVAGREYRAPHYETRLGGSVVNFVIQAKRLGAEVGLIGKRGDDEKGKELIALLQKEGIASDLIAASPTVQTSVDTGIVLSHNGKNIQLVSGNANQSLSLEDVDTHNPLFESATAVYLGGFLKQESLYQDYPKLLREINQRGVKIFLDHGRIPVNVTDEQLDILRESLQYVEAYLPNESEIMGFTGEPSLDEAIKTVLDMGPKIVAVKMGEKGCRVKSRTEDIDLPGYSVDVISTVGAGDSFNAAFTARYLQGNDLGTCAQFANAAAAFRVSQNRCGNQEEVMKFVKTV